MSMNGTGKWIVGIAAITLCFTIVGVMYAGNLKRIEKNEIDVRRVDKNQAVILYKLEDMDEKLDRLLNEK